MTAVATTQPQTGSGAWRATLPHVLPFVGILLAAVLLPFVSNDYWVLIGTRMAIYWVLVSGLNLVVGFAGHLAIGYVALLTLGAYATSVLVAGNVMPALPVFAALPVAGLIGAVFGVVVGLPALRLRTFYFAMSTLGFATIVTQIALAWQSVTGGGIGIAGPEFPAPFNTPWGFYALCTGFAVGTTWLSANVARSRFGRALIAVRDAEVAAEASGISKPDMLIAIFLFAGALAAIAGGLFASLQTYITPDAFTFDLSVLFFIAILIGGRGSILGPMLGTIILTILPEIAAPLAAWSTFLYAVLLLLIVLVMPGGIAALLDFRNRRPLASNRAIVPRPAALADIVRRRDGGKALQLRGIALSFGNVRAIDGLDLDVAPPH
ncbi:MAG: branched-chain amino acid ABC transporter permease, partial [Bradyrhizobium sp.]